MEKRVTDYDLSTVEGVREAVALVAEIGGTDDEAAHVEEDIPYTGVLAVIAAGTADDPAALAAESLRTAALDFSRWYA